MGIIGGYDLRVICDDPEHSRLDAREWESTGTAETRMQAIKEAREAGWKVIRKANYCQCPACIERDIQRIWYGD